MKKIENPGPLAGHILRAGELIKMQGRILTALMLRDLSSRFFGSKFGFLISVAWPLTHILVLLVLQIFAGRIAPYGNSVALWLATGIIPFMSFSYMSRFIALGIVVNKPLLVFPRVKVTDVLFARALVEVLSAGIIILILVLIFWTFGIDFMPLEPAQAFMALISCMLLGVGIGVINAIISAAMPLWVTGFTLFMLFLWLFSGIFFVAHAVPEPLRSFLALNPIVHGVEWMRSAYYEGYGSTFIDKPYLIGSGLVWLFLGLVLERFARGRLLSN